jgi:hypothetical protein
MNFETNYFIFIPESHNEYQEKPEEDIIQSTIGNFGRWQFKISTLMALLKFPIAWFQMSIVFLAPPTQFWCKSELSINSTNGWLKMIQTNHSMLRHVSYSFSLDKYHIALF